MEDARRIDPVEPAQNVPEVDEDLRDFAGLSASELWEKLVDYEGPDGVSADIVREARTCWTPAFCKDAERREKTTDGEILAEKAAEEEAGAVYEHPLLQSIHEFIIDSKLSIEKADALLNLWTEVKCLFPSVHVLNFYF